MDFTDYYEYHKKFLFLPIFDVSENLGVLPANIIFLILGKMLINPPMKAGIPVRIRKFRIETWKELAGSIPRSP